MNATDHKNRVKLSPKQISQFQRTVLDFYRRRGRAFPWRETRNPYAILVSEVMLQQTQTERVVPFFKRWMRVFPTVETLARAPLQKVLRAWSGLGYNRRALNLKRAAQMIMKVYGGTIPRDMDKIDALPGVGPYTASAIMAFAFGIPSAFIETNIRTVYLHFFFKKRIKISDDALLKVVRQTLPRKEIREWYSALMDYGAMLKKTVGNPNARSAGYSRQSTFKGSRRELRGAILRHASQKGYVTSCDLRQHHSKFSVPEILSELTTEGFLKKDGSGFELA